MKNRNFYKHKSENFLFVTSVIVSFIVFIFLSYLGFEATIGSEESNYILNLLGLESNFSETVMTIGGYISIAIIFFFVFSIMLAYSDFKIKAKAHDVHVTEKQFSVLLEAENEYIKKLGIKKKPTIFVSKEKNELEVHGARVDNPNVIRIPCAEIIATANKNYYSAKFTIARQLACIYMGYYNPIRVLFTVFSFWVPILCQANNRAMTYATDKIAAELIGKEEVINSIIEEALDIWFIPYVNIEEYIENSKNVEKDKEMMWANIFSDTPIPAYRIEALLNDKDGKLF